MNLPTMQKAPVAELGGESDEGQINPSSKEVNDPMIACSLTPAQWCKTKEARERIDLHELAHGTVLELFEVASRAHMAPSDLIRLVEEEQP